MIAVFSSLAEDDLKQAYEFYEANDAGLALKFMMAVRQTVDAIEKSPLRFPVVFEASRKAGGSRFVEQIRDAHHDSELILSPRISELTSFLSHSCLALDQGLLT